MHSHVQHVGKEAVFKWKVFERNGKKLGQRDSCGKEENSEDIA